ncbi:MAG: glutathione-disulfide reductase [Elainellaceae cyanobacterium]
MAFDYDFLVIGGGSGGLAASKQAASYGKSVAIIEQEAYGGTCANRGCVPKKLIVYAADVALEMQGAAAFGWLQTNLSLQWSHLTQAIQAHVDQIGQSIASSLREKGIDVLRGRARFEDPHTIVLEGTSSREDGARRLTAETIVIAVGGRPSRLGIPGADYALVSDDMFTLPDRPQRLAVMGGGYIGVEFSSMLSAFGSEVTLLDPSSLILSGFDHTLRQTLQAALCDRGIKILGETVAKSIEKTDSGFVLNLKSERDDRPSTIEVDQVLMAVGRQPHLEALGLDKAGVEIKDGAIAVDDYSQTTQAHVYAVGDCTNRLPLTPVAIAEGEAVARTVYGEEPVQVDYQWVPSAVFARPESASVGLTESDARQKFGDGGIEVKTTQFQPLKHQFTETGSPTLIKLVADRLTQRVLGLHMVGDHAAEIVQTAAIAIKDGITCDKISQTIGIHPSTGEELLDLV